MRTSKKIACSAATLLGMFAGAAQADEPAIVRISDKAMQIPSSGPMPTTLATHESFVGDAECMDGNGVYAADGGKFHWPDHGFRRPVVTPIARDAIVYHRYWPHRFYGQPGWHMDRAGQFPMVYMPTDTTQLGWYYQRVPQWQPNPSMIPGPPNPSDWTMRESGYRGGMYGSACEGTVISSTSSPTPTMLPSTSTTITSQPTTSTPAPADVPPAPPATE